MQIECRENQAAIWVIESPGIMRGYLGELLCQFEGEEGRFVLSEEDKIWDISKQAELILNPFEVDVNDKKFTAKAYLELKELALNEDYYLETQQLISSITAFFMEIERGASVRLDYGEADITQIFKAFGVRIDDCENEMVGKLGQYLHVLSKLMRKKAVIFFNLSSYLEPWEIERVVQEAFYLKMYVILMETREIDIAIPKKYYITQTSHIGFAYAP